MSDDDSQPTDGGSETHQNRSVEPAQQQPNRQSDPTAQPTGSATDVFGKPHVKPRIKATVVTYIIIGAGIGFTGIFVLNRLPEDLSAFIGGGLVAAILGLLIFIGPILGALFAYHLQETIPETGSELYAFIGGTIFFGHFSFMFSATILLSTEIGGGFSIVDMLGVIILASIPAALAAIGAAWATESFVPDSRAAPDTTA